MTPMQNTCESIVNLAEPELSTLQFAIAMIELCLMAEAHDIDWSNDYRNALVGIREVVQLAIDKIQQYEVTPDGLRTN